MNSLGTDVILVIEKYLSGAINSSQFQEEFIAKMKTVSDLSDFEFDVLDRLFAEVNAFCDSPILKAKLDAERPNWYLDEKELRIAVLGAIQKLQQSPDAKG
jgi:hypothetical protein